jgi:CRISPR-associated RAMP protein (TIGR02581 family)
MSDLLLDTFHGRTQLQGVLTTRTSLHIGAGGSGDPLATDLPVVRDAEGKPYVPGASLKGVLRSAAEALHRGAGRKVCNVVAKDPCISHETLTGWRDEAKVQLAKTPERISRHLAEQAWTESCPVCRLFGSLALAGRVRFPDLLLSSESPVFELRNGVGIDRDRGIAADKILYDFEAVPPGTAFGLTVIVDNPTDAEIGLLLYLLSGLDEGHLALGGKTSRGLGQVAIEWKEFHETTTSGRGNPFKDLLVRKNLLAPEVPADSGEPTEPTEKEGDPEVPADSGTGDSAPRRWPETGDQAVWQAIVEALEGMTRIDRTKLGERVAARQIRSQDFNNRLAFGLDDKVAKKRGGWDMVFLHLAEFGTVTEIDGTWWVAGSCPQTTTPEPPPAEAVTPPPATPENPALNAAYERFLGAMAHQWDLGEEEPCSIAS